MSSDPPIDAGVLAGPATRRAGGPEATEAAPSELSRAGLVALVSGHTVHDTYQAFLAPLLPGIVARLSLSLTQAALLDVFLQAPSIIQPVIGYLSDRLNLRWVVILGPALAGLAMSLLVVAPSYAALSWLLILAGVASAAIHAAGPTIAANMGRGHVGRSMGVWMVGGELGRALGPAVAVLALSVMERRAFPWLMSIGFIASAGLLYFQRRGGITTASGSGSGSFGAALIAMRRVMLPLGALWLVRSFALTATSTFLPLYLTERGAALWMAGGALTLLQGSGVLGAFLGGIVSDRLGRRAVMFASIFLTGLCLLAFTAVNGWLMVILLILLGLSMLSIGPVVMAMVYESYPESRSMANGTFMTTAFLARAVGVLVVGIVADNVGLQLAFRGAALVYLLGLPLILLLPTEGKAPPPDLDALLPEG